MRNARTILVDHLHRLMRASGWWIQAKGEWDVAALNEKVKEPWSKGSRRYLYRVLRGQVNFSIDEYEKILTRGFGARFELLFTAFKQSDIPEDVEDIYTDLRAAIDNARRTGSLEAVRFGVQALAAKVASDRALMEKMKSVEPEPPPTESPPAARKRRRA